ncbi:hypothetical protein [Methylobacterium soli]|uniref:Uncharacterized protein n=1 Tax=Methylobacterium soli TaxID=553447 RepID=A0A6L3SQW7_9HYPH|nr:hypothetical protein [Methylobacterium soli]KAB1072377.1 hypothetical protein F6X53_28230 [Methylobacterium soli]GJE46643.1 hypothetical protein AEGHOMDF_5850 [Methylobacterium soli]
MLDIVFRIIVAGGLMLGTAHLPSLTAAHATPAVLKTSGSSKAMHACAPHWAALIRARVA